MKNIIRATIMGFILAVLFSMIPFEAQCTDLSDKVLRLHIKANSDTNYDQELKLKVRDEILHSTEQIFDKSNSKYDSIIYSAENLENIKNIAENVITSYGYNYSVKVEIKKMYFNTRYYKDFTMPAGYYDALNVLIGKAEGHNWWCVLYPTVCVGASSDKDLKDSVTKREYDITTQKDKYQVKLKLLEYVSSVIDFFS